MNKHQVDGRLDQAMGKVKEVVGKTVGNERLEGDGLADQVKGKAQAGYGDAKQTVKDKAKKLINKI